MAPAPTFQKKPSIRHEEAGKKLVFECLVEAEPQPAVKWFHNGQPLQLEQPRFKGVDPDQTGDYKCIATNKHGSGTASINLNFVQSKPKIPDGRAPKFPRKPVIKQSGQILTIECVVEANPKPSITWYHDQTTIIKADSKHSHCTWQVTGPITNESELRALGVLEGDEAFPPTSVRSSFSSRSSSISSTTTTKAKRDIYIVSFNIRQPKASDGGLYRCNAINELGESSANIALNFQKQEKLEELVSKTAMEKSSLEESEEVRKKRSEESDKLEKLQGEAAAKTSRRESDSMSTKSAGLESRRQSRQLAEESLRVDSSELSTIQEARRSSSSMKQQQQLRQSSGAADQVEAAAGSRRSSADGGSSAAGSRRTSSSTLATGLPADESLPMEVDGAPTSAPRRLTATNRLKRDSLASTTSSTAAGDLHDASSSALDQAAALEQLPPAKRTSSTGSTKRTISVKKKRPSLLGLEGASEGGAEGGADGAQAGEAPPTKKLVKKRVSVKRSTEGSALKLITEEQQLQQQQQQDSQSKVTNDDQRRDSATSVTSSVSQQRASKSTPGLARDRIPSVSVEAPAVVEPPNQEQRVASGRRTSATGSRAGSISSETGAAGSGNKTASKSPTFSVSDSSQPADESRPSGGQPARLDSQKRRGLYDGLRPTETSLIEAEEEDREEEEAKQRLREPPFGFGRAGSRRGSVLLVPEGQDSRRPSIIVPGDNKLRPGEIADRRRRSSIDIRRASAIEVEAADRPSTPLRAVGKKPAIVDFQDSVSGTENHTSYLTFGVEGDPVPALRFFKGDSEIYEGGRYSIVTDDESGMDFRAMLKHRQYAKWKRDQDDPNWGNLKAVEEERLAQIKDPKRPDNFIKPLQNQKVKQGKDLSVRFECVFSKSGVKAKWFRNNKEIFPNKKFHLNSRGDLHVLEIDGPYVEDGGKITCQCLDTKCSAMLEVEEPDPVYKFSKMLAKGYGQHLNRELVLECTCNSYRAQVNWFKDDPDCKGEPLKEHPTIKDKYSFELDKFGKKILRIKYCQFEDSGRYSCKIMNTPRLDEITTTQALITEKKFQIMKPLYSQRATEDDKVILECEVDEYDAPVKWFRKDRETGKWKELKPEQMKHKEIVVDGKKRRLIIKKAKCNDEGEYKCCTNADETACELFVEPSNKWRKKLIDITVVEDEPLTLEVELMERKPGVALVWSRNGKEVGCQGGSMQTTADERIQFKTADDKLLLLIEHAKPSDAGDWSVNFNKMKCACKVTVLPAEKAPAMRFPSTTISAEVGKAHIVEIPYQIQGTKQSAVLPQLLCNGQLVSKDKVELVVKEDKIIMKFKNPERADTNENYEFILENAKGKQAQKFKLDVQGPPGTPQGPLKVTDVFKDKCKLSWERPLDDGGSPVAHYVVERQEVGSGRTTWTECGITSTTELDVKDLSPKKEYKFRVRAVNKKGKSEPLVAAKTIIAKDPYDPPSEPENLVVINWDKDFVDLEWEAPMKDGGVPVEKYIIESKSKFTNDWTAIKEVPAGQGCKAHITETLKEGAQLQFRVRAANKMGQGEPSKATKPVVIKARFVRPYIAGDGLKNIVVKKGRPIRYEINFNGEPPPEVSWIANDLELKCLTDKCEIDNAEKKTILQVVSEADVVVLDRPAPPEGPLVVEEIKSDQVTIKWRKPKDSGGQDIEGYVVEKMNLETGRWVPAGECGPKEEMFTVTNLMKGKKYKFRVRAKNKEGESEALETLNTLNVGEEPTIGKCPKFKVINMDTGEEVCESGSGGAGKAKYTVFDDYLTVTIPDANKSRDSGKYKVVLKNKIGSTEANFDLDVTGPPGPPQGPLELGEVTENSVAISWRPPADDGGNKVTHYIVERRDTSQGEDAWIEVTANCKDTSFNVTGLTKDNAYEFRVMAVNDDGQSKPDATPLSEDSVLLEWEKPKSDGGSRITGYLIEKREVGSDTWQKVNPNLPCLTNEFTVKNLIEDRKYEFRVIAQNAAGNSDFSECSAETLVKDPNASDVPKFVKPLKKTVGVENGSFELECVVQGHPPPTIVWSKGDKDLRDGNGKYCMTQESGPNGTTIHRLLVSRASAEDADEYSIKATNKAGSRTSRCDVEIQTKPKISVPARLAGDVPVAFDRGESIQLKIPFSGNPPPRVRWFKGDEEIEPSAQFDIESDGRHTTLTIRDATREDSGEYRLEVENALGKDSASFNISVSDRPEPPRFPTVDSVVADSATIKWKAPLWDGGSHITQYVIEKRELPMTSWIKAATTRFLSHEVVNLNDEKEYEFRVFAENIYGRSEPSEIIKCTTRQSAPDDYDKFVKDGPVNHMAADIKTHPITDDYEILERIGEGIFGEVYRVREKATGDYYAAKFVPTSTNEEKALLKKEIDVNNLLHHKNILRLHDAYEDEDEMVTVHEFISGPEVYEKICEPGYQMTEEQVKKYMRDVCEAVRHMHDRNVIHLDLKPENLVLQSKKPLSPDHEPKVKIVDFGLA
ncbi:hypothetical protein SUGI_1512200, partial [Cryptomeria japonica]